MLQNNTTQSIHVHDAYDCNNSTLCPTKPQTVSANCRTYKKFDDMSVANKPSLVPRPSTLVLYHEEGMWTIGLSFKDIRVLFHYH